MKLSVIIVNWNTCELLRACIQSLLEDIDSIEHEVFVVDNASTDGSTIMVRNEFPSVVLIANSGNVGFPRANNQVLPLCRGEYILLLNPDTETRPRAVLQMLEFLEGNPSYGAVGPKLLLPDGTIQRECACSFPTLWNMFCELTRLSKVFPQSHLFGRWRLTFWDHGDSRDIECLLGAAILARRQVIEQVGMLDEHMYVEDVDLCYRINAAGWRIRYLSDAEIVHYDGASRKSSTRFYHHYQIAWHGLWYFFSKHHGQSSAFCFRVMTLICSAFGLALFSCAAVATVFSSPLSRSFMDKARKAMATFSWSVTPARTFEATY